MMAVAARTVTGEGVRRQVAAARVGSWVERRGAERAGRPVPGVGEAEQRISVRFWSGG